MDLEVGAFWKFSQIWRNTA